MQTNGLVESIERARCGSQDCRCSQPRAGEETAPVLLLGLGNPLMADDGAGQKILARLESEAAEWGPRVEFVDGGTQGLALLGKFEGRKAVLFLDAIRLGEKAGAVHLLHGDELMKMGGRATTAHEGSAPDILRALELLGDTPAEIALVGIEPEKLQTGIGLSPGVEGSIGLAAGLARMTVNRFVAAAVR
ncbi:MAG TPA: hydrogenase maturation protease [Bryobacteraceae bacterium]|nr:hydrogenase maturation protease [Bryobacteraceae bacterium]